MSRKAKGARLYLRQGRADSRSGKQLPDVWVIRDGATERSTGFPGDRLQDAERALADYINAKAAKDRAAAASNPSDPACVDLEDVLRVYAMERAPELFSEAKTMAGFIRKLGEWWSGKKIADVRRSTCKDYIAWRTAQRIGSARLDDNQRMVSDQTARRELEVLSAAIGYWHGEHTLTARPEVWLPPKPESQRDALTRPQAARLLKAAMGFKLKADGSWLPPHKTTRTNRLHLRRFLLIGFYTGTRSKVITSLLWTESPDQAWVDLEKGMVYRKGKAERERANKRRPVVRIPARLLAHMRRWRALDLRLEKAIQDAEREDRARRGDKSAYEEFRITTVMHFAGNPIVGRPRTGFAGCVADAGLPDEITPHWLRHTAATWLMEGGADPWEAAAYLGMSPKMLEDNYGHHRPDYQANARRASGGRRREE